MNLFFMLLTTVSANSPAPVSTVAPAPVAAAPVASAPVHITSTSSCGGDCGAISSCCEDPCAKPKRSWFRRRSKDCCEVVTCAPVCQPAPQPCCAPVATTSCAPACGAISSCCEDPCAKPKRSWFRRRSKDCCEVICDPCNTCQTGGCANGSCGGNVAVPAGPAPAVLPAVPSAPGKAIEPIKKMPSSDAPKGAILGGTPTLTPTGAKVETDSKNPF